MKYFGWTLEQWAFAKVWYLLQTGNSSIPPDVIGAWEIQKHWFYVVPHADIAPHAGFKFPTGYILVAADYPWAAAMVSTLLQDY